MTFYLLNTLYMLNNLHELPLILLVLHRVGNIPILLMMKLRQAAIIIFLWGLFKNVF